MILWDTDHLGASGPAWTFHYQHCALFNGEHQSNISLTEGSKLTNYQNMATLLQVQECHMGAFPNVHISVIEVLLFKNINH